MKYQSYYSRFAFLMLLLSAVGFFKGFSQPGPITRMGSTNTISFDEGWFFQRYGLQPDGTRKEEPSGLENTTFNDAAWQKLKLPHDWAITGPFRIELEGSTGKLPWKGIGWYRKHFTVPVTDAGKQIFVDFDGVMANAKIWLNGKYVGTWPYGYSSFRMDLTPYIMPGKENILAVRLDTENWDSRWYPGAGIYRHVWLVKTAPVHVDHWGTYITTPQINDQQALVNVAVTVSNQSQQAAKAIAQTILFELDPSNKPTKKVAVTKETIIDLNAGERKVVESQATVFNPKRWDIESPNRYVAQTTIRMNGKVIDTYYTPFGIRTLEFTARNGFLLNGKRVQINGTCNHHDLGALGAAFNQSALIRQLKMLKDMGCNSLRTSHNPPAPELLELADKMGFLVWDEAFDAWKKGKRKNDYNKIFDEWHEKDLKALVHRDRNHPSVFIWSIGNEVMEQQNVELTKHLVEIVQREDPTRPVSNGYNDPDGGRNSGAATALGLMGVNYFFGQQPKWDADPRYANKPTIGSETSSCVSTRGEYFFGSKDYQNWQISSYDYAKPGWGCSPDEQFRTNAKYPHLLGEYVWTGFDYLGEPTPYNSDETNLLNFRTDPDKKEELEKQLELIRKNNPPSRSSYFGIIDLAGFPKDRFYSYQAHWRPDFPMAHIFPHWNWPERIDSITPVHVYTSGDEAELFLNGKSLGRKIKTPGKDFRLVWDSVRYVPGELKVVSYKNGKQWATDVVKTTGEMSKLVLSADRSVLKAGQDDLCFITVKVTDKDELMVPRSHPLIQFSIEGAGEIVATDNGDPTSFVPFQSHERPAFNGMALVIVKAKGGAKGKFTVHAKSEGLTGASIKVESK
ncbi:beta-galactosidase GalB [Paraflavisolibacter caeni]|nr:beta-galactosidase GalB [Paraflavisolibacter caeni]